MASQQIRSHLVKHRRGVAAPSDCLIVRLDVSQISDYGSCQAFPRGTSLVTGDVLLRPVFQRRKKVADVFDRTDLYRK